MKNYTLKTAITIQNNNFACVLLNDKGQTTEVILNVNEFMKLKQTGFISASKVTRLQKEQQGN